jgi:hypothetical protein
VQRALGAPDLRGVTLNTRVGGSIVVVHSSGASVWDVRRAQGGRKGNVGQRQEGARECSDHREAKLRRTVEEIVTVAEFICSRALMCCAAPLRVPRAVHDAGIGGLAPKATSLARAHMDCQSLPPTHGRSVQSLFGAVPPPRPHRSARGRGGGDRWEGEFWAPTT